MYNTCSFAASTGKRKGKLKVNGNEAKTKLYSVRHKDIKDNEEIIELTESNRSDVYERLLQNIKLHIT